jgi:hypothetical protein
MQKALKQNNLLKISRLSSEFYLKAEREGFEPPVPLGTTVFKTVVIDHSTISPMVWRCANDAFGEPAALLTGAKVAVFFGRTKFFVLKSLSESWRKFSP